MVLYKPKLQQQQQHQPKFETLCEAMEHEFAVTLQFRKTRRRYVTMILNYMWPGQSQENKFDGQNSKRFLSTLTPRLRFMIRYARMILIKQAVKNGQVTSSHLQCNHIMGGTYSPLSTTPVNDYFNNFNNFDSVNLTERRKKFREYLLHLANEKKPHVTPTHGLVNSTVSSSLCLVPNPLPSSSELPILDSKLSVNDLNIVDCHSSFEQQPSYTTGFLRDLSSLPSIEPQYTPTFENEYAIDADTSLFGSGYGDYGRLEANHHLTMQTQLSYMMKSN